MDGYGYHASLCVRAEKQKQKTYLEQQFQFRRSNQGYFVFGYLFLTLKFIIKKIKKSLKTGIKFNFLKFCLFLQVMLCW